MLKRFLIVPALLTSLSLVPAASAKPARILDCGFYSVNPYVAIDNITTRHVDCGTGVRLSGRIYHEAVRRDLKSFQWNRWSVRVRLAQSAGTEYDIRWTASGGRVVHFQVYFE